MTTSRTTGLSEPMGNAKISLGTLGYVRARNRQRVYDLVIREFKKSGLTQAELARRLGKAPEVVSRLLSRPGNWELDTLSDVLFAISGAVPTYRVGYPLAKSDERMIRTSTDATKLFHPYGSARRWLEWMHISSSSLAPVTTASRHELWQLPPITERANTDSKVFEGVVG